MSRAEEYLKEKAAHLMPDLDEWPINILSDRRSDFILKIKEETSQALLQDDEDLMAILQHAVRLEKRRIKNDPWSVDPPNQKAFWNSIAKSLREIEKLPSKNEQRKKLTQETLLRIITVYAEEIAGRFKPSVFRKARVFCKIFFSVLFNRFRTGKFGFWGGSRTLFDKIRVVGPIDKIRKLFETGTLVFVPTHSSNLDSLLLGHAMDYYVGLPSSHYGAGLNLYNSEIAGYYMNRLGAYRVDRRKKNKIYLETLKSASRIAIELGVNSLFFPGGTRSRSGELEQNLKLGLLSTVVQAQRILFKQGSDKKIYVVPLIISYSNVLEDRSLFSNYLFKQGLGGHIRKKLKAKNVILRMMAYFGKVFSDDMRVYLSFAEPVDVFGNLVDNNGHSIDKNGNRISKREYFESDGIVTEDIQRESVYTKHLAEDIADKYRQYNVVRSCHIVAGALLSAIRQENKIDSMEATVKLAMNEWSVPAGLFYEKLKSLLQKFRNFEKDKSCLLEPTLENHVSIDDVVKNGIKQLKTYQMYYVVRLKEETVETDHIGLLMYYANRLECYFEFESRQ